MHAPNPLPAYLPGLSKPVESRFCRNPLCAYFGDPDPSHYSLIQNAHKRYFSRPQSVGLSLRCKCCGFSQKVYNDRVIAEVARASLARHLPVYTCPDPACENHNINVFDPPTDEAYYSRFGLMPGTDHPRIRCNACAKKTFRVGEKPILETNFERQDLFMRGTLCGLGPQNQLYMQALNDAAAYANTLFRQQRRCNFFTTFANREFWNFKDRDLYLYTDFMEIGIKRPVSTTLSPHHFSLFVLISVLRQERHLFLLAVTPAFQPMRQEEFRQAEDAIIDPANPYPTLDAEQPYIHLESLSPQGNKLFRGHEQVSPLDLQGSMIQQAYAALGHFYMLRVLLRASKRVFHYIDQADALRVGVLSAFADRSREDRAHVTFVSSTKKASRLKGKRNDQIDRGVQAHQDTRKKLLKTRALFANDQEDAKRQAILHRKAFAKKRGSEYDACWIRAASPGTSPKVLRTFWATYKKDQPDLEKLIHQRASLNPVDSCISALRTNLYGAGRPTPTSGGLRGYRGQPELPLHAIAALDLFRYSWNYRDRIGDKKSITRAQHFGVSKKVYESKEVLCTFQMPKNLLPPKGRRRRR